MELDDIKFQLKQRLAGVSDKSEEELEHMLTAKTRTVATSLRKSLRVELALACLFLLAFVSIVFYAPAKDLRMYLAILSAACLVFVVIIFTLLKKVNQLCRPSENLNKNLQTLLQVINEYTRRYFQFVMGLVPAGFVLSFYLGYNNPTHVQYQYASALGSLSDQSAGYYVVLAAYFLGTAIALFYFTRWYLKRKYGKYTAEIIATLNELNNPG